MQLTLQWDVELINDENIVNNRYIGDILINILTQNIDDIKINENSENIKKNSKKLYKK